MLGYGSCGQVDKAVAIAEKVERGSTTASANMVCLSGCFFFSSRRRHTRFDCDWSSDVCSSDLRPLHFADHIAEMKRTPLGTPLIWFKAPTSLLPHNGTIEIAFPEHQTDFEVELADRKSVV